MKLLWICVLAALTLSARGQPVSPPTDKAPPDKSDKTEFLSDLKAISLTDTNTAEGGLADQSATAGTARTTPAMRFELSAPRKGEVPLGKFSLTGAAVKAIKERHPLQLINPFAPADYDNGENTLVRDPVSGRASGWRLVSLVF